MSDLYKLEWIHSMKTIQDGITKNLNKDAFMDTIIVCQDGVVTHNRLVLGLVFPELCQVPVFDVPQEQTVIMPEHSTAELQNLIQEMFPSEDSPVVEDDDRDFSEGGFLEYDIEVESPKSYRPRGRGRPPLNNVAKMPARFTCDYCHKGFFYRSMLTAHEKLHTGGSRETCHLCGAEYSTRQNLKNHMIKQHGEDSFTPRKRGRPPLDPDRRSTYRPQPILPRPPPQLVASHPNPQRPFYRGRGRPPLMTKHAEMSRYGYDNYNVGSLRNSLHDNEDDDETNPLEANDEVSAESFMEQKMEDDSDGEEERLERELEAIRQSGKVSSTSATDTILQEPEDVKPDISSLSNSNHTNSESSKSGPSFLNNSTWSQATTIQQEQQSGQLPYNNSNANCHSPPQQHTSHQSQPSQHQNFSQENLQDDSRSHPEREYQV